MIRLNADNIRQTLESSALASIEQLDAFSEIDSTNSYLLNEPAPAPGKFKIAVADSQTAGRGRMTRPWFSHTASSICLSLSHNFVRMPKNASSLTLATGIGIIEALASIQIGGINLKWPNDLMIEGRKMGGILTEVMPGKSATVVIGVGLNVDLGTVKLSEEDKGMIANASDLRSCNPDLPEKSLLVAALIAGIQETCQKFARDGFHPFFAAWDGVDFLRGRKIVVDQAGNTLAGKANGIADSGELLLSTSDGTKYVVSGSVRLMDQEAPII